MAAIAMGILSVLISSGHINDVDMSGPCNDNYPYQSESSLWDICLANGTRIKHPIYSANTSSSSWSNIKSNWGMSFDYAMDDAACAGGVCDFHSVFAIVFPAATGIMEGANLSGDLKDPSRSIPRGTLYAVAFAILTYVILMFSMGASFPRDSLRFDMDAFQVSSYGAGYPLLVGILVSSLSSALRSLFGGARVRGERNLFLFYSFFFHGLFFFFHNALHRFFLNFFPSRYFKLSREINSFHGL